MTVDDQPTGLDSQPKGQDQEAIKKREQEIYEAITDTFQPTLDYLQRLQDESPLFTKPLAQLDINIQFNQKNDALADKVSSDIQNGNTKYEECSAVAYGRQQPPARAMISMQIGESTDGQVVFTELSNLATAVIDPTQRYSYKEFPDGSKGYEYTGLTPKQRASVYALTKDIVSPLTDERDAKRIVSNYSMETAFQGTLGQDPKEFCKHFENAFWETSGHALALKEAQVYLDTVQEIARMSQATPVEPWAYPGRYLVMQDQRLASKANPNGLLLARQTTDDGVIESYDLLVSANLKEKGKDNEQQVQGAVVLSFQTWNSDNLDAYTELKVTNGNEDRSSLEHFRYYNLRQDQ